MRFGRHHGIRDPIGAEAEVLAICSTRSRRVAAGDAEYLIDLVVHVPGVPAPVRTSYTGLVPADCVPRVGERLPVTVSASNPARVVVLWEWVPPRAMAAFAEAELHRRELE
jgi:hypothetical protein